MSLSKCLKGDFFCPYLTQSADFNFEALVPFLSREGK